MTEQYPMPRISLAPLATGDPEGTVARAIDAACRQDGFFTVTDHGIAAATMDALLATARAFFALPEERKLRIAMARGGRAWRGYFPVGGELTSGVPDQKEGLYVGSERPPSELPLHGPNLFPDDDVPALRHAVLAYIDEATRVAMQIMSAIARSHGLAPDYFARTSMQDPTLLFRIFRYPPSSSEGWGVGEHTDYGVLTLLLTDDVPGLEVFSRGAWRAIDPQPGALICNIGDMLDRMTGGVYRSTPHRVRNETTRERFSFPLFFDPSWDAHVERLPNAPAPTDDAQARWDRANVHAFNGTWGEYLLTKVSRVFPDLFRAVT